MSLSKTSITSDKDYLKIWQDAAITISANGAPDADSTFPADPSAPLGFTGSTTINHPLGVVPLVRAFWDAGKNGLWYATDSFDVFGVRTDPWLKVIATTTQVKLIMNTDGAAKTDIPVFYRIYDLGNKSVDSDSRIDKVFFKDTASGTVAASPFSIEIRETILTIPHTETEAPLFGMQFSENQVDWHDMGTHIAGGFDPASGGARYYFTAAFITADATNLYIHLQSNYDVPKTIYARFVADYRQ